MAKLNETQWHVLNLMANKSDAALAQLLRDLPDIQLASILRGSLRQVLDTTQHPRPKIELGKKGKK
jgi:hypothetical protein